jgi:methyl-accepting chemotaxis protein
VIFGRFVRAQDLVVGQLSSKIASLDSAANILVEQSEVSASSTQEQSAAIQQTDVALNQVQEMISKNVEQVRACYEIASLVQENTRSGASIMDELSAGLMAIQQTNTNLQQISKTIEEIASKTDVINSIVQKTELLSFNASIEAARAGDQGKGFAIVAIEIGKLAQTSGEAATQIDKLIDDSRKFVGQIVKSVEEKTSKGRSVGDQSVKNYADIQAQIGLMMDKMGNISEATKAQEKSVAVSVEAMGQLGTAAQKTVAASSEFRGLADRLKGESTEFDRVYRETRTLIFGESKEKKSA